MILKFRVEGQTLFPLPTNDIPREGSRDYLKVDFDFGCGTEAYTKTVYFTAEEEGEEAPFSTAVIYDGEPIQVEDYFAQKSFSLSVGFVLGNRSYTTNEISVPLDPASDVWLNLPPNLDIPAYQQLVMLAQESRDLAQEATEEASGAAQLAKDAADAASGATQIARDAADAAASVAGTAASALDKASTAENTANAAAEEAEEARLLAEDAEQTARDAADAAASVAGTAASALDKASTAENTANAAAEDAEEARLLAGDAEQTAITAISMGNHVIRASTADGVSYVAPKSDTLPAITTGTAGGHKGKGTRIVLIPSGPNTAESPTLKIGDGEVIPIRLRSAANKGDNDGAPDATDDIPIGALMAGVPYAMTFCGKYWLIDSLIGGIGGGKVFVQPDEPKNAVDGSAWIDTDEEPEEADTVTAEELEEALSIAAQEQKAYVDEAIAQAGGSGGAAATDITDTVMEWMFDPEIEKLPGAFATFYIAALVQTQYGPGRYIAFDGAGQFDVYYCEDLLGGVIRANFQGSSAELLFMADSDETIRRYGYVSYFDMDNQKTEMLTIVADLPEGFRVTGLAEPTEDSGAANKKYVDDAIAAALDGIALAEEGSY